MKNKLHLKILIFLVLILGGIGYLSFNKVSDFYSLITDYVGSYLSQRSNIKGSDMWVIDNLKPEDYQIIPTSDQGWNLYRNFKYGFQFQYPSELRFVKVYKLSGNQVSIDFSSKPGSSEAHLNIAKGIGAEDYIEMFNLEKHDLKIIDDHMVFVGSNGENKSYIFDDGYKAYDLGGKGEYIDKMFLTLEFF